MTRPSSADILAVFERAKRDPDTNREMRRVLTTVHRNGRVGDLSALAGTCKIPRDRIESLLDRLAELDYLPASTARQAAPLTRGTRNDRNAAA